VERRRTAQALQRLIGVVRVFGPITAARSAL